MMIVVTADKVHPRCEESLRNQDYDNYEVLINVKPPVEYPGKPYFVAKNLNIAANREEARLKALKTDAGYFLWGDSDIVYPRNTLSELILQMKKKKSTIPVLLPSGKAMPAGQRIPQKHLMVGWYKNRWSRADKEVWLVGKYVADGAMRWFEQLIPSVMKADYFGLGCVCMTRELLKRVVMLPGVEHCVDNQFGHFYLDEGGALSMQADALGYECWADGNIVCEHIRNEKEQATVRATMAKERTKGRQAFLFIAHYTTPEIEAEFQKLKETTKDIGDCFWVGDQDPDLGYPTFHPNTLVPGSSHFHIMDFFRKNHYAYYWNIEYDVRFTGDWEKFFKYFNGGDEDFVSSHIRFYEEEPEWWWWPELKCGAPASTPCGAPVSRKVRSFDPIYRLSHRALELIDAGHKAGWSGHNECLIPTILFNNGMTLRDFGGTGSFVRPEDKERFYLDGSDWRMLDGTLACKDKLHHGYFKGLEGKLFHPVKGVSQTPLCGLAQKWRTDKGGVRGHHYTPVYHELFKDKRNDIKKVLEVGIGYEGSVSMRHIANYKGGASLRMWAEYFPNAEIYGADIKIEALFNEDRIKCFQCDQSDRTSLLQLTEQVGCDFDLIVDDGSHETEHQILAAKVLLPLLKEDGVYVVEDVKTNFIDGIIKEFERDYICESKRFTSLFNPHLDNDNLVLIREITQ